jgi:hypothetical protein
MKTGPKPAEEKAAVPTIEATAAVVALAAGCAACMLHPATLQSAHRIIEQLIH